MVSFLSYVRSCVMHHHTCDGRIDHSLKNRLHNQVANPCRFLYFLPFKGYNAFCACVAAVS